MGFVLDLEFLLLAVEFMVSKLMAAIYDSRYELLPAGCNDEHPGRYPCLVVN